MKKLSIFLFFTILFLSGCTQDYPFEGCYIIHPSDDSDKCLGVAVFSPENEVDGTCFIYLNNHKVFASRQKATYKGTPDDFQFTLSGKDKSLKCTLTEYDEPIFEELPENKPYSKEIYEVEVTNDVRYGTAQGYWTSYNTVPEADYISIVAAKAKDLIIDGMQDYPLFMDVYQPIDAGDSDRPLLIMIHGGAFFFGDKASDEYVDWCTHFARMGYVAVSLNYRLGFLPAVPLQRIEYRAVQDANAAVRYLLHNNDTYHIDTENIFAAGTSAGAITALNLAYLNDDNRPRETGSYLFDLIKGQGGIASINPDYTESFAIKAVGNMWGAVDNLDILDSSPMTSVISFHSHKDIIVPFGYGRVFSDIDIGQAKMYGSSMIDSRLKELGRCSELHTYQANRHSLHVDENGNRIHDKFNEIQDGLTRFFSEQIIERRVELNWSDRTHTASVSDDRFIRECRWKVNGGVILDSSDSWIKVLFFDDAEEHSIVINGKDDSGWTFLEKLEVYDRKTNTFSDTGK